MHLNCSISISFYIMSHLCQREFQHLTYFLSLAKQCSAQHLQLIPHLRKHGPCVLLFQSMLLLLRQLLGQFFSRYEHCSIILRSALFVLKRFSLSYIVDSSLTNTNSRQMRCMARYNSVSNEVNRCSIYRFPVTNLITHRSLKIFLDIWWCWYCMSTSGTYHCIHQAAKGCYHSITIYKGLVIVLLWKPLFRS